MAVTIYKNDIPKNFDIGKEIAVDTETMGLKFGRDRLCLVQIASSEGTVYICLLYTSPSPRDSCASRMPSSA